MVTMDEIKCVWSFTVREELCYRCTLVFCAYRRCSAMRAGDIDGHVGCRDDPGGGKKEASWASKNRKQEDRNATGSSDRSIGEGRCTSDQSASYSGEERQQRT